MLQSQFLRVLFEGIRQRSELKDLSVLIDSNGRFEPKQWDEVLDLVDGFMIDVKAISSEVHQQITGKDNHKILESIAYLNSRGKLDEVRMVVVPGYNDTREEIEGFSRLLRTLTPDVRKVLIKMRKHGIRQEYAHLQPPTDEDMQRIWAQIGDAEVKIV
jgi:pyruvate-formate lyase-activating enzyme